MLEGDCSVRDERELLGVHELENAMTDMQAQKLEDVRIIHAMELQLIEKTAQLNAKRDESRLYCQVELEKSLQQNDEERKSKLSRDGVLLSQCAVAGGHIVMMINVLALTLAIAVQIELLRDAETTPPVIFALSPYFPFSSLLSAVKDALSRLFSFTTNL